MGLGIATWFLLAEGVGVPLDGYPSAGERLQHVAINRGRADPNNVEKGTAHECSEFKEPRPPVVFNHDLSQAARFHCRHLSLNAGGLSHQTFCTLLDDLETSGCDASASCSCVAGTECWNCDTLGGCGSGPDERAAIFGFQGGAAEVGAAGYPTGWDAVVGWITENPCESGTLAHRDTLTGDFDVVGVGMDTGGMCWGAYHFAEFSSVEGTAIPAIPAAAHRQGATGMEIYANWFHTGGDPMEIHTVVDGACTAMDVDIGAAGNSTFVATIPVADAECHTYYVVAYDPDGIRITYPEIGSLTFGTACTTEYEQDQAEADCDPLPELCGDDRCDAAFGESCTTCIADCGPCGEPGPDGGDDGTGGDDDGPAGDDASPQTDSASDETGSDSGAASGDDGACACTSDPRPAPLVVPLLLLAAGVTRRRSTLHR